MDLSVLCCFIPDSGIVLDCLWTALAIDLSVWCIGGCRLLPAWDWTYGGQPPVVTLNPATRDQVKTGHKEWP